uniref:Uncharacterized protein n=1 Tax=Arundo donax TaxID=35708 RepID=A0A0A9BNU2_ARUDO
MCKCKLHGALLVENCLETISTQLGWHLISTIRRHVRQDASRSGFSSGKCTEPNDHFISTLNSVFWVNLDGFVLSIFRSYSLQQKSYGNQISFIEVPGKGAINSKEQDLRNFAYVV